MSCTAGQQIIVTQIDLAIAATASVEQVPLLTGNTAGFQIIADLLDVRLELADRRADLGRWCSSGHRQLGD